DGGLLAVVADQDNTDSPTVTLWNVSPPNRPELLHRIPSVQRPRLAFSPAGTILAVTGENTTALWRIP
ncbi:hypothetical protein, partial [Streptomyces sp. NPDC019890]|uniref:hypothetical protein n=1 Tax=Streptomyces sp. NPDC019890 TaxID=3365064 RepID=UPI00384EED92